MEDRFCAYLEKLTGEPVSPGQQIAVSSTQRAQIVAWLNNNGVQANMRDFKANLLSVRQILSHEQGAQAGLADDSPARQIATSRAQSIPPMRPVAKPQSGGIMALAPLGLGIDLQALASMPMAIDYRSDRFYQANFSASEIAYCVQQGDPRQSFCGLWAAKEAVIKAGAATLDKPGALASIEIGHCAEGAPSFPGCMLSISHEAGLAIAVCVRIG